MTAWFLVRAKDDEVLKQITAPDRATAEALLGHRQNAITYVTSKASYECGASAQVRAARRLAVQQIEAQEQAKRDRAAAVVEQRLEKARFNRDKREAHNRSLQFDFLRFSGA